MDELLIEDKKYISSKRAAQMTGYAKDYVGQLCREGRVPARLVGRSWYVLESAIQDHRFQTVDSQPEKATPSKGSSTPAWESPRYEPLSEELLPSVSRLQGSETGVGENLQDSWKAWFDRVAEAKSASPVVEKEEETQIEEVRPVKEVENEEVKEEEAVNVPIHTVYDLPPESLLPRHLEAAVEEEEPQEPEVIEHKKGRGLGRRFALRTLQLASVMVAIFSVTAAVLGTGYLDKYVLSNSQVRILAGVVLYNK